MANFATKAGIWAVLPYKIYKISRGFELKDRAYNRCMAHDEPTPEKIETALTALQVLAESSPERLAKLNLVRQQIEDGTFDQIVAATGYTPAQLDFLLAEMERLKND